LAGQQRFTRRAALAWDEVDLSARASRIPTSMKRIEQHEEPSGWPSRARSATPFEQRGSYEQAVEDRAHGAQSLVEQGERFPGIRGLPAQAEQRKARSTSDLARAVHPPRCPNRASGVSRRIVAPSAARHAGGNRAHRVVLRSERSQPSVPRAPAPAATRAKRMTGAYGGAPSRETGVSGEGRASRHAAFRRGTLPSRAGTAQIRAGGAVGCAHWPQLLGLLFFV